MIAPRDVAPEGARVAVGTDSHEAPAPSSSKLPLFAEAALLQKVFLSVPETAFLLRVSVRSVWRLMADPASTFPEPRRVRGRTLLERDAVLKFMQKGASR